MKEKHQFNPFGKWSVLVLMCTAIFIIVFDSTAMSVAIKNLIVDLDTDIGTIRNIMSVYTLVMAALIMGGAKLGDVWGIRRAFLLGVVLFGVGTFIAAISQSPEMLLLGWSIIEGTGAAVMLPATMVFLTNTYSGKDRAVAFSVYAGIMAVAAAVGPILGGFITTFFSWRWVFGGELVFIFFILAFSYLLKYYKTPSKKITFDHVGLVLSAASLSIIVFAILTASNYGWLYAEEPFEVGGAQLTLGQFSVIPLLILIGIVLFYVFKKWCERRKKQNKTPLLDFELFRNRTFLYGTITNGTLNMTMLGMMFIFPVYLQLALNKSAFETGIIMIPFSIAILLCSLFAGQISHRFNNKHLIIMGILISMAGFVYMVDMFSGTELVDGSQLFIPLLVVGAGIGFVLALLANMTISAVRKEEQIEGSGVINSFRNLGSSMGTALFGTVLILFFIGAIEAQVMAMDPTDNSELDKQLQDFAMVMKAEHSGADLSGYSQSQIEQFETIMNNSAVYGMKMSFILLIAALAVTLFFSLLIPKEKPKIDGTEPPTIP